ncbi:MAG: hypothetical protein QOD26_691 [Betaproteobacteria bacterium]|nr:hypothetical protein [Betaproteobacteria bacterium]
MRLAVAAVLALLAGCAPPGTIKAYEGSARSSDEVGTVLTEMLSDTFIITNNEIVAVDGVRYEKGGYRAELLPGVHRIGLTGTLRVSRQVRVQHCTFDLNADAGCTYRPSIPSYPRDALDQPADAQWRVTRVMTVIAECRDTSYALQLPIDCSGRP